MKRQITKAAVDHANKVIELYKEQEREKELAKKREEANGDPCYDCGMTDRCGDCKRLIGYRH